MIPYRLDYKKLLVWFCIILFYLVFWILLIRGIARAEPVELQASWYSRESLVKEGTYKITKGVTANGEHFNENNLTCACRLFPLHSYLRVTECKTGRTVIVKVTDRIGKRFAKTRIDLSPKAFAILAPLSQGLISCKVERIR